MPSGTWISLRRVDAACLTGVEAALGSNWIARGEYRYSDYGTMTNTDVRQNGGALPISLPSIVTYDLAIRTHMMTLGAAYRFD